MFTACISILYTCFKHASTVVAVYVYILGVHIQCIVGMCCRTTHAVPIVLVIILYQINRMRSDTQSLYLYC